MDAIVDSSSLISLARAGLLQLLAHTVIRPVVLDAVRAEAVDAGQSGGHPDAAAIEAAIVGVSTKETDADLRSVDAMVLQAAREVGLLVANDLALGRRARNLGVRWLRTADLVLLLVATEALTDDDGRRAILALLDSGRITAELSDAYLEELT